MEAAGTTLPVAQQSVLAESRHLQREEPVAAGGHAPAATGAAGCIDYRHNGQGVGWQYVLPFLLIVQARAEALRREGQGET